jgi:hypothetical protein
MGQVEPHPELDHQWVLAPLENKTKMAEHQPLELQSLLDLL